MRKTTRKLISSLTILTLIFGLIITSAVKATEIEEPVIEEEVEETTPIINTVDVVPTSGIVAYSSGLVDGVTTLEQAFPDSIFRSWVAVTVLGKTGYDDAIGKGTLITQSDIDKIEARTSISVASMGIESLAGIEYFTGITSLIANGNKLTGLLDVTHMSELTNLTVNGNQLEKVDVSGLEKLKTLYVQSNLLTELNLSNNTLLEILNASSNKLTDIDVTDAKKLTNFQINTNELTEIDLSNNDKLITLRLDANKLTGTIDVTHMESLTSLYVNANQFEKVNVSGLSKLKTFYAHNNLATEISLSGNVALELLNASNNKLTDIDIAEAKKLTNFQIQTNELIEIDLSQNDKLSTLRVDANKLSGTLDLTHMSELSLLYTNANQLEKIDVSELTKLKTFYANNNSLVELKLSGNTTLELLNVSNNKLTNINVTDALNLTSLHINTNELTSIDVSKNSKLTALRVDANKLTGTLDVTHMENLSSFYANANQLEKINVSNLAKLKTMYVHGNVLSELGLSGNTMLELLNASNNKLVDIDVSDAINLTSFSVNTNKLTTLDISNNGKLTILRVDDNKLVGTLDVTHMNNLATLHVNTNMLETVNVTGLTKLTTFYSFYNPKLSVNLSGINTLTNLSVSKATNADLSKLTGFYVTGSKGETTAMVRLSAAAGAFSWDAASGYYVIAPSMNAQYAVGVPKYDEENNFIGIGVTAFTDLSQGALMDNEGNLVIGASLNDIDDNGKISLDSGTVITGDGVYDFDGGFSVSDGVITTDEDYTFSKNIIDENGTAIVGGETITITIPEDGLVTIDTVTPSSSLPAGSTVVNNDGDKTYVSGPANVDKDGNVSSDDHVITVPADKVGEIEDKGTSVKLPDGSTVTTGDETIVYPGEIVVEDGTIKFLPFDDLLSENGTDLSDDITQDDLDKAKEVLNDIDDGKLKDELKEKLETAQDMLDAIAAVDDLFDKDGDIKDDVDNDDIKDVEDLIDELPDGDLKDKLQNEVDKAKDQLEEREKQKEKEKLEQDAKDKVDNLFTDSTHTAIKDSTDQAVIDDAQKAVDKLTDSTLKTELQKEVDKAQAMLDARNAVNDLFDENGTIKDDVTQDDVDHAEDLVNKLPDSSLKDSLLDKLKDAQNQLDILNANKNGTGVIAKPSTPPNDKVITNNPSVSTSDSTNLMLFISLLAISGFYIGIRRFPKLNK